MTLAAASREISIRSTSIIVLAHLLQVVAGPASACEGNIADPASDVSPIHDPAMIKMDDTYYVFSSSPLASFYTSSDMRHWSAAGQVFDVYPDWILRRICRTRITSVHPTFPSTMATTFSSTRRHIGGPCNAGISHS